MAAEYPDVETDYNHVDACCMWIVKNPEFYDVIVTTNMFGDIITDLSGIIQGGMGVAAGGNINPEPGGTSMFEPMGGSAPKYTGTGKINPIAAINAVSMLLDQLGEAKAAAARDERHHERHRHQDEKPNRRQDGLHDERGRRFGVRGFVIRCGHRCRGTFQVTEVAQLAELIRERNEVAWRITQLIGRPAQIGHIGEWIASRTFDIELEVSAVAKGIDGRFRSGPLQGKSVRT